MNTDTQSTSNRRKEIDALDFTKIEKLCASEDAIVKVKITRRLGENICRSSI